MMALIFVMLLVTVILAWVGRRRAALYLFGITMLLALVIIHGITSNAPLQF